jgi:Zn-dependent protease with chaperone function/uncharacterized tellurite resistance protein B-like protein
MDFFTAQDHARRNTGRLVLFFLLAVLSLIILTNLLVMLVFGFLKPQELAQGINPHIDWKIFFMVSGVVLVVVAGGTLYKISRLSGGGDAVAAMFGGKPVFGDDKDFDNRKLVNVVEEMAIASGTPVPQVYILNEDGINAFAAGFTASDAVIAVTRGAVRSLTREQLQGVVAHEFSHILNGDMRLNVRLVGILHGILLIGLIGGQILRGSGRSSRRGSGSAMLLGLGLLIIGYTGTFFGNLIKAAVSRQREFLADAAAVQFTRNPDGIGGALMRIGGYQHGSMLHHPKSEEMSHAYFNQGVKVFFTNMFATHPPLPDRIKRILPAWDGIFLEKKSPEKAAPEHPATMAAAAATSGLSGAAVIEQIGRPDNSHILHARQLLKNIDKPLLKVARDPFTARAALLFLVLDSGEEIRTKQLQLLKTEAARGVYPELQRLVNAGVKVNREQRVALAELALPSLRRISEDEARTFLKNLDAMIRADGRTTIFEWCLFRISAQYIDDFFQKPAKADQHLISNLEQVKNECAVVLTMLVVAAHHAGLKNSEVFRNAIAEIGLKTGPVATKDLNLAQLDRSLKILRKLKPKAKSRLIQGCVACVEADGRIEPVEFELLRAVAATLSVPMPPVAISQS